MSKTAHVELTEKQRQSLFKKFSRYNLFGDLPHVPVKGVEGWPPAENATEQSDKTQKNLKKK